MENEYRLGTYPQVGSFPQTWWIKGLGPVQAILLRWSSCFWRRPSTVTADCAGPMREPAAIPPVNREDRKAAAGAFLVIRRCRARRAPGAGAPLAKRALLRPPGAVRRPAPRGKCADQPDARGRARGDRSPPPARRAGRASPARCARSDACRRPGLRWRPSGVGAGDRAPGDRLDPGRFGGQEGRDSAGIRRSAEPRQRERPCRACGDAGTRFGLPRALRHRHGSCVRPAPGACRAGPAAAEAGWPAARLEGAAG